MKRKIKNNNQPLDIPEDCCVLCRLRDDRPDQLGEKVYLKEEKLAIHYLCLLTASGVYQRGQENDGVFGFLVDDIRKESRRCDRLTCGVCRKKGAAVGCCVRKCRKTVHFPCGQSKHNFIFQFTGQFLSYCIDHAPQQSVGVGEGEGPQSCSVCLDLIPPVLCYSVLKCPACHNSWFHRACIQRQAQSAGLHFFRCSLCNNKERFQLEMLTMGIYIPDSDHGISGIMPFEGIIPNLMDTLSGIIPYVFSADRDASWELESNAFEELLQVYENCDAPDCCCRKGRSFSAKSGWFEVLRCRLCGSRGTHRKCAGMDLDTSDWSCLDCTQTMEVRASLVTRSGGTPQDGTPRSSLLSKRCTSPITSSPVSCKRSLLSGEQSSTKLLQALALQLLPPPPRLPLRLTSSFSPPPRSSLQTAPGPDSSTVSPASCSLVEVHREEGVLEAGLKLVRRPNFDPRRRLSVRFNDGQNTRSPSCPSSATAAQYFLKQLVQQIQTCGVFEGPEGNKNLTLESKALREDFYFDVGILLAMCLVHGGPPLLFFSPALFQCLFNFPCDARLSLEHMTPDTHFTHILSTMAKADSVEDLQRTMAAAWEYLELAGCNRPISSLDERDALVDDMVGFTLVTRMQLPLQRFREGLKTLGVFEQMFLGSFQMFLSGLWGLQVQQHPAIFYRTFCGPEEVLDAHTLGHLLTPQHFLAPQRLFTTKPPSDQHLLAPQLLIPVPRLLTPRPPSPQQEQGEEPTVLSYWKTFLQDCEDGRSSVSLQDLLCFTTGVEEVPATGLLPSPTLSFILPQHPSPAGEVRGARDEALFPQSDPSTNRLLLPSTSSSYQAFKSSLEQAVSHRTHLLHT
ncbi:G2/M phase-specific E3 ubiquitin-protein ligase [Merluccius polli]|uniref:G2/M phase-specific E3 ubiquitin-protein ligase n=1 Tax=Merluccius polli TaxID=89951 RepID=A0AA47MIB8_MERPO|nr:G2/M phase-specific E3 ubiquitin-protein ligase [Merluccius polli]